jgi:hypothetical protein
MRQRRESERDGGNAFLYLARPLKIAFLNSCGSAIVAASRSRCDGCIFVVIFSMLVSDYFVLSDKGEMKMKPRVKNDSWVYTATKTATRVKVKRLSYKRNRRDNHEAVAHKAAAKEEIL